jgi:tripartite-type tricarboxylate transporter receptor subunit TctC
MRSTMRFLLAILAGILLLPTTTTAQEDFFKDKRVRFVVGYPPGGGYDLAARIVARHMGRHIPGNPSIIVQNMPGGGSRIAANHINATARPDGLTVGIWNSAFALFGALGDTGIRFDGRKVGWLGASTKDNSVCAVMGFTGQKTWKDVVSSGKELHFLSTAAGSISDDLPRILNLAAGTKFKVTPGYTGTGPIILALQRKEGDGWCTGWLSMRANARDLLAAKGDDQLIPFVIQAPAPDAETKGISLINDVLTSQEGKAMYSAWASHLEFFRPFSAPPGLPPERLAALRRAFAQTFKDPQFLADAKKVGLEVALTTGEEIEKMVAENYLLSPALKEKLKFLVPGN